MQVHWVDEQTGEVGRRALKRSQLAPFLARRTQCRIVLEACCSGHYWGRTLSGVGHEVRPDVKSRIEGLDIEVTPVSPEQMTERLKKDLKSYADATKMAKLDFGN